VRSVGDIDGFAEITHIYSTRYNIIHTFYFFIYMYIIYIYIIYIIYIIYTYNIQSFYVSLPLHRGSIPYDKHIYRPCFAVIYVHTYIQMFMWFSGTSTIYFIRPKYCALLVQSNTRKELLLRKRICALGLLSDARSTEDVRHSFDRQSVPKINIVKRLLRVYQFVWI